jgi:hypothetical protein
MAVVPADYTVIADSESERRYLARRGLEALAA